MLLVSASRPENNKEFTDQSFFSATHRRFATQFCCCFLASSRGFITVMESGKGGETQNTPQLPNINDDLLTQHCMRLQTHNAPTPTHRTLRPTQEISCNLVDWFHVFPACKAIPIHFVSLWFATACTQKLPGYSVNICNFGVQGFHNMILLLSFFAFMRSGIAIQKNGITLVVHVGHLSICLLQNRSSLFGVRTCVFAQAAFESRSYVHRSRLQLCFITLSTLILALLLASLVCPTLLPLL